MKKTITTLILCLFAASSITFAAPPAGVGGGGGNGANQSVGKQLNPSKAEHPKNVGKANKFDKTDLGITDRPPGLQDKGTPPGLAKKNKTPPGWDKGEKRGWDDNNDNAIERSWHRFLNLFE